MFCRHAHFLQVLRCSDNGTHAGFRSLGDTSHVTGVIPMIVRDQNEVNTSLFSQKTGKKLFGYKQYTTVFYRGCQDEISSLFLIIVVKYFLVLHNKKYTGRETI